MAMRVDDGSVPLGRVLYMHVDKNVDSNQLVKVTESWKVLGAVDLSAIYLMG